MKWAILGPVAIFLLTCWVVFHEVPSAHAAETCRGQIVWASWFGKETCHGRPPGHGKGFCETADGTPFNGQQWLLAHRTLPFGTKLRITYRGKSVVVPVKDRGPYIRGRTLDMSAAVARTLGAISNGVVRLCMEIVR